MRCRSVLGTRRQEIHDLLQRLQRAQMLGLDLGSVRQFATNGRHDFDAFDRVDAKVGVQPHVEVQHLDRITGLVRNHFQQSLACTRRIHAGNRCGRS